MKFGKMFKKVMLLLLALVLTFAIVGCNDEVDPVDPVEPVDPVDPVEKIEMTITSSAETIKKGESVTLTVEVKNTENTSYTWSVSDESLIAINNNVVTVIKDVKVDTIVTITATSVEDTTVNAKKTLKVIAPVIEGQVGELTSEMISEIGNSSITVSGTVTDVYRDFNQSANNSDNQYDVTVKMSEGKWNGSWNLKDDDENVMTDCYRQGETDGLMDQYGNVGHGLERLYVDKNNAVASKLVTDYMSKPAIWEAQHLWNHLANLQITKFVYDAENQVYEYKANLNDIDDLFLLTYLSYSLTPLLEDTLTSLYLRVEDGEIVEILGQTETLYYGENTEEDPDGLSYTTIRLAFSDVGTTVVEDPTVYDAPEHVEILQQAIEKMQSAKNYTFRVTDVTTYAPSTDSGDYEVDSTSSQTVKSRAYPLRNFIMSKVANNNSSVGTVGRLGKVTEEAVLFADTIKYSYTMDGKEYHTEYTGYKQNADNSYDVFAYSSTADALYGTKKINGSMLDALPKFDFSANVFSFSGSSTRNGKTIYTFYLNESAITRDMALEVSCYKYADDGEASSSTRFTISVDGDGNLVETVFPYSISGGTYLGYCRTVYSEVGTTVLDEDLFDGYAPRVLKTDWNEYVVKYYSPTNSTLNSRDEAAEVVFDAIYQSAKEDMPSPLLFLNIFGDNINGPFYDWREKGTDADGNTVYKTFVSITTSTDKVDENGRIANYEELMDEIRTALAKEGFAVSVANTDMTGGATGLSDRYLCMIKNDIQIVIQNNHTKYFWIYFYKTGDWTLNR